MEPPQTPHRTIDIELTGNYDVIDRIPPPAYRHAAPSAPWPWIDIRDSVDKKQLETEAPPVPKDCDHTACGRDCWENYPQSRFPNWTESQVRKCKIYDAIHDYDHAKKCVIHKLDVNKMGIFHDADKFPLKDDEGLLDEEWERLKNDNQGDDIRVRALFVEQMTGPALRMLGGKYNIEPFFFSSSLNWIPSHFQEDRRPGDGDHITVTLPFIQSVDSSFVPPVRNEREQGEKSRNRDIMVSQLIDTQAPLRLDSNQVDNPKVLVLALLSVHLIRNVKGNTIISFHTESKLPTTRAAYLHERIRFAGQSVYWQKMLEKTDDPTFLLLIFVWHAMYAWDEALQHLYEHICVLETEVINTTSMELTEELHTIRAHLLHYSSLLAEFKKIVQFILDTKNPALTEAQQNASKEFLERECNTLLEEINRLNNERLMQEERLKNVIDLVFSSVNIIDSKAMQKMTEATVRDSAAMKQIAYLTMVFLPASFVAGVFGMNVKEIVPGTNGTLPQYFETTCGLTAATVWIIIAFQSRYLFAADMPFWLRLGWPIYLLWRTVEKVLHPERFKQMASEEEEATPMFDFGVLK